MGNGSSREQTILQLFTIAFMTRAARPPPRGNEKKSGAQCSAAVRQCARPFFSASARGLLRAPHARARARRDVLDCFGIAIAPPLAAGPYSMFSLPILFIALKCARVSFFSLRVLLSLGSRYSGVWGVFVEGLWEFGA